MLPSAGVWEQENDRLKGTVGDFQLGVDGEQCRPYVAGRVLLRSLTQQLEETWNVSDNVLISSIAVWCASAVVCDADDELLAEHAETPNADADLDPSFAKLCQRLRFRLESCLIRKITELRSVQGNLVESISTSQFKQPNSKLGLNSVSLGSNYAQISVDTAAADMELSTEVDGIAMPDDDYDSEAAIQPAAPSSDFRYGHETTLSSEAIVQWMRGCTPASSEGYGGTSTESTSTTASSIQASTSFSALSLAVSFKSQGVGGRAQLLLDNSINAIALLSHAMQLSEFVMVVQLAGASGVCRAVVKSLANLASKCVLSQNLT